MKDAIRRIWTWEDLGRLKTAGKLCLSDAGGASVLVSEGLVRVGTAALSRATVHSPANADHFVALDVALDLDKLAGEPHHTRAMAELLGYRLEAGEGRARREAVSHRGLNRLERIADGAILDLREALEDGVLDAQEAAAVLPRLRELQAEIERKIHKVEAAARGAS